MSGHHNQVKEALLVRFASLYIAREANRSVLITPIRATLSANRAKAIIYVSVFPDTALKSALSFLNRRRSDFFKFLKKESRISRIPSIQFEFDFGEKNRQRLDELSREI